MIKICDSCNRLLEEGDQVVATVASTYHVLKSSVAHALDREGLEILEPLRHRNCQTPKGEPEGD